LVRDDLYTWGGCVLGEMVEGKEGPKMQLSEVGRIVEECWLAIPEHFPNVILDEYVIMPNHVHGLFEISRNSPESDDFQSDSRRGVACYAPTGSRERYSQISPTPESLGTIIRSFKSAVTKRANELYNTPSAPFWQRNYYEHGIRTDQTCDRLRDYIKQNPFMWHEDEENPKNLAKQC
jgi:putative transposase